MPQKKKSKPVIALATGGTGGHFFPAQALAVALKKHGFEPVLICDQRTKEFVKGELSKIRTVKIFAPKPATNIFSTIWNMFQVVPSVLHLRRLLKAKDVSAVVGFGGYPSFPTMAAALSLGLKTYIHEQNAVLGRVNRILAPFVTNIFTSFEKTKFLAKRYTYKTKVVGNLVRENIIEQASIQRKPIEDGYFNILIIGGSQGASILSSIVPKALLSLPLAMQQKLKVTQQVRRNLIEETNSAYSLAKFPVTISSFFDDIAKLMLDADLIIARAGASTVTEIAVMGRPSILVPYRHAKDNHQYYNAQTLVKAKAAILIAEDFFKSDKLALEIKRLISKPKNLEDMSKRAKTCAILGAAEAIVNEISKYLPNQE